MDDESRMDAVVAILGALLGLVAGRVIIRSEQLRGVLMYVVNGLRRSGPTPTSSEDPQQPKL